MESTIHFVVDSIIYPSEWQVQSQNCELFELAPDSDEWKKIEARIKESSSIIIKKIQR
jgi:hypothetical protein